MTGARQPLAKPLLPKQQPGALAPPIGTPAPTNGTRAAKTTDRRELREIGRERLRELGYHRIGKASQQVSDVLAELYGAAEWLGATDYQTALRLARLIVKHRALDEQLETHGLLKTDGDPKKALAEFRQLSDTLLRHEERLGLPASARSSLGLNVARGRAFDAASRAQQLRAESEDVAGLEARVLRQLQGEGDDAD